VIGYGESDATRWCEIGRTLRSAATLAPLTVLMSTPPSLPSRFQNGSVPHLQIERSVGHRGSDPTAHSKQTMATQGALRSPAVIGDHAKLSPSVLKLSF
jgi:hypothetical protein